MLKIKRMAILAVVALGLVALAAPAGASAKSNKRLNEDVKRLGNNVHELRVKTDELNNTVSNLAKVAGENLLLLKDNLTTLGNTTANFKYGVVQVGTVGNNRDGDGPTGFWATPPMYKTGEQATVTFPIVRSGVSDLQLITAVRSLKPDDETNVSCRVTIQGTASGTDAKFVTLKQNTTNGIFVTIRQSDIKPSDGNTTFPYSLTNEDDTIDLANPEYLVNALKAPMRGRVAAGTSIGTLSCLVTDK